MEENYSAAARATALESDISNRVQLALMNATFVSHQNTWTVDAPELMHDEIRAALRSAPKKGDYVTPTGEIECDAERGRITDVRAEHYSNGETELTYMIKWNGSRRPDPHGRKSFEKE